MLNRCRQMIFLWLYSPHHTILCQMEKVGKSDQNKIVIIDDELNSAHDYITALEERLNSHEILYWDNINDAFKYIVENAEVIKVIIVDVMMPRPHEIPVEILEFSPTGVPPEDGLETGIFFLGWIVDFLVENRLQVIVLSNASSQNVSRKISLQRRLGPLLDTQIFVLNKITSPPFFLAKMTEELISGGTSEDRGSSKESASGIQGDEVEALSDQLELIKRQLEQLSIESKGLYSGLVFNKIGETSKIPDQLSGFLKQNNHFASREMKEIYRHSFSNEEQLPDYPGRREIKSLDGSSIAVLEGRTSWRSLIFGPEDHRQRFFQIAEHLGQLLTHNLIFEEVSFANHLADLYIFNRKTVRFRFSDRGSETVINSENLGGEIFTGEVTNGPNMRPDVHTWLLFVHRLAWHGLNGLKSDLYHYEGNISTAIFIETLSGERTVSQPILDLKKPIHNIDRYCVLGSKENPMDICTASLIVVNLLLNTTKRIAGTLRAAFSPAPLKLDSSQHEVILLIHGIRTLAIWQRMVKKVLEEIPGIVVQESSYGYFGTLRFWCPFLTRQAAIDEVKQTIQEVRNLYPDSKLSVIAHSNGTYIITRLLLSEVDLKIHKLVLCGSIVSRTYPWHSIRDRLGKAVINDYGTKDSWPVWAKALSWGYGDTGRHIFGKPGVKDRGHDFKHSDYFADGPGRGEEFVRKYWKPWFEKEGEIFVDSDHVKDSPYFLKVLSILPVKWILFIIVLVTIGYLLISTSRS